MSSNPTPQPSNSLDVLKSLAPAQTQPPSPSAAASTDADSLSVLKGIANPAPAPVEQPSIPPEVQIPEEEKGASKGVERGIKGVVTLLPSVWHAMVDDPRDDEEAGWIASLTKGPAASQTSLPEPMARLLYRVVIAPMINEHRTALAYEKIAQSQGDRTGMLAQQEDYKKDPEAFRKKFNDLQDKRALASLAGPAAPLFVGESSSDAQHNANMHHIASVVPLLGPMAAGIVEHFNQGDKSGAVSELLTTLGLGSLAHEVGGKVVPKLAPRSIKLEGEDIPVTASQAGQPGAQLAESAAKLSGKLGERQLVKFAGSQADQIDKALSNMARRSALQTVMPEDNPLMMSAEDVRKASDVRAALAKSNSFGEASSNIRAAVNNHFALIDEATDGEFSKLQNERAEIRKAVRNPLGDSSQAQLKLNEVEAKTSKLLDDTGIGGGHTGLEEARRALAKSYALDDLDDAVNRATKQTFDKVGAPLKSSIQGGRLLQEINKMDPQRLQLALGDAAHVESVKTLAGLLQSSQNIAKMDAVSRIVRASKIWPGVYHPGALAASEATSLLIGKILTSPRMASTVATSLRVGANAPAIANAIVQASQQ